MEGGAEEVKHGADEAGSRWDCMPACLTQRLGAVMLGYQTASDSVASQVPYHNLRRLALGLYAGMPQQQMVSLARIIGQGWPCESSIRNFSSETLIRNADWG